MQTARHILLTLLVFGLLTTGVPLTGPEDANHDKRVDLEDAILCIRDLVQTAETPASFAFEAQTAISLEPPAPPPEMDCSYFIASAA